ncbi:MAG: TetR/AcrR family transcriptional regulator [Erysipelotrichaceae bacterium]
MNNLPNKRVRTTELLLKKSLFEYLAEKPITEINVRMICNKAQINRSTFYLHYKSIDDLLACVKQEEIRRYEEYVESFIKGKDEYEVCVHCLKYIKENAFIYKVLLSGNYPDFEVNYIKCISKYMKNNFIEDQNLYESIFVTAGCLHISKYWLDNGFKQTPQEISQQLLRIISKHF